jgi:hypothetical protein
LSGLRLAHGDGFHFDGVSPEQAYNFHSDAGCLIELDRITFQSVDVFAIHQDEV